MALLLTPVLDCEHFGIRLFRFLPRALVRFCAHTVHSLWAYTSISAGRVPGLCLLGWTARVQLSCLNEFALVDTEPNDFVPGPLFPVSLPTQCIGPF